MRTISSNAIASQNAEATDEVWLVLLTIDHADLEQPIRVVNNQENITSRSNLFVAFPFEIDLPGETPDGPGEARLTIDNTDKQIVETIRSIPTPPSVTIEVILADDPDVVEVSIPYLTLRDVTYDVGAVSGALRFDDIVVENVSETITPSRFPGLF